MKKINSIIMKKFTFLSALLLSTFALNAQINTELRIYHTLGAQESQANVAVQNNLTNDYKITRLEYYMSGFTVVHDGGQETAISMDTVALMRGTGSLYSTVQLGELTITDVEAIKFHIGVPTPANNANPSLYPASHPLAPKNPSMHWGWAAGYRFLVYEGVGGANFSQTFQLHGLGNSNYIETTVATTGQNVGGTMYIVLDADYIRGVENIDVSSGVIAHGVDNEDLTALENFSDYVFTSSSVTLYADLDEQDISSAWSVFPNPSKASENVSVTIGSELSVKTLSVTNALGQAISTIENPSGNVALALPESGVYFVNLIGESGIISTKRVVKN